MTIYASRAITVSIDRDCREVYDFASIPENFQRWAEGLGRLPLFRSGRLWAGSVVGQVRSANEDLAI